MSRIEIQVKVTRGPFTGPTVEVDLKCDPSYRANTVELAAQLIDQVVQSTERGRQLVTDAPDSAAAR